MSHLGRQDGYPLVVDLRGRTIESWSALWDALAGPCGLPGWFGRNLDAWWDTIDTGAISAVIDAHPKLILRVARRGMFASDNLDGAAFAEVTNESAYATLEVEPAED
ncbi:MAG: barstar family protein [Acidimicrobiales bacterium]